MHSKEFDEIQNTSQTKQCEWEPSEQNIIYYVTFLVVHARKKMNAKTFTHFQTTDHGKLVKSFM